jgi:hypothetical protein
VKNNLSECLKSANENSESDKMISVLFMITEEKEKYKMLPLRFFQP